MLFTMQVDVHVSSGRHINGADRARVCRTPRIIVAMITAFFISIVDANFKMLGARSINTFELLTQPLDHGNRPVSTALAANANPEEPAIANAIIAIAI